MVVSNIVRALTAECRFYFDDEARNQIFDLIRDAKSWLYLVSPYNKHPQQLKVLLTEAIHREVSITMLYRDDRDQREGVSYLEDLGATVLPVEWLHSKVYLNEYTALASSMNLLDSSFNNSSEFCIRIDKASNGRLYDQLDEYVQKIQLRAERRNPTASPEKPAPSRAAAPKPSPGRTATKSAQPPRSSPQAAAASATGHCIRCSARIPLNPDRPFCPDHFKIWNRYKKADYEENYCHRCGEENDTSKANPLCRSCLQSIAHRT